MVDYYFKSSQNRLKAEKRCQKGFKNEKGSVFGQVIRFGAVTGTGIEGHI